MVNLAFYGLGDFLVHGTHSFCVFIIAEDPVGSMIFGVGLFNFVAILINQYLGHLVSLLSFLIGGVLIWVSLAQVGIL